jgi:hypothetical protein
MSITEMTLNKTTLLQTTLMYGDPDEKGEIHVGPTMVTYATYKVMTVYFLFGENVGGRTMTFFFHQNLLVGYCFRDGREGMTKEIEHKRIPDIYLDRTKVNEIVGMFGRPNGRCIEPMVSDPKGYIYCYYQIHEGTFSTKIYTQFLVIGCNKKDVVTSADWVEVGEKREPKK